MKRRPWTRSEKILFAAPLGFVALATGAFGSFELSDRVFRGDIVRAGLFGAPKRVLPDCSDNVKNLGLAMLQYAMDNDQRFPPVATQDQPVFGWTVVPGWATTLRPYVRGQHVFRCPQRRPPINGWRPIQQSNYYLNAHLATRSRSEVAPNSILLGEGNDGLDWNDERYAKWELPASWRTGSSPARRHLTDQVWARAGGNYVFPDGHVKRLSPSEIGAKLKWTGHP